MLSDFDTPKYPENYIHRIGRTGRAKAKGKSILFYSPTEIVYKEAIENLMGITITEKSFPSKVQLSKDLLQTSNLKKKIALLKNENR